MVIITGIFFHGSWAQDDREPAVAGQFYPGEPSKLKSELKELFDGAKKKEVEDVVAVISPHAGYIFSGNVAASSFKQIDPDREFENIFVLASSHRMSFEGGAVYSAGDYLTPLGKVKVNRQLAEELIHSSEVFTGRKDAHRNEHSLEVQLPFLQYHLKKMAPIVPIVIGAGDYSTCEVMARALKPYFNERNLFVISTDFSHYPEYQDAQLIDQQTAEAVISNDPDELIKTIRSNRQKNISNLATSLCGWSSVLTLMYMTEDDDVKYRLIDYKNSGDTKVYGDKERVVGYWSIAVSAGKKDAQGFSLSEEERSELLKISRNTLESYVSSGKVPDFDDGEDMPGSLNDSAGAFVTLMKDGKLRGCIGRFDDSEPLWKVVRAMTVSAASEDHRFPGVKIDELDEIDIEISVITPLKKISDTSEIEIGKHGIYVRKGFRSGTLLPQVPVQRHWSKDEFLGYCCRDKARIGWEGWKDAELYVYESLVFSEQAEEH